MKLLMVHPHDIFSDYEPWTVRITYLAREMMALGHEVKLVYFPLDSINIPDRSHYLGIELIPLSRKANPLILMRNIRDLLKIMQDVDLVHFQKCFHFAAVPVVCAAWILKKPLHYDWDDWESQIYHLGGHPPSRLTGFFLNTLEKSLPKLVDTMSVASHELKRLAVSLGFKDERICLAPVGADLNKFNPGIPKETIRDRFQINGPLVMYLGQLHGGQYVHLFIKAAAIVAKQHPTPHVTFMIVGGGENEDHLRGLIRDLGAESSVMITGLIPHEEVPLYVAAADIAIACFEDNDITRCKSPLKIVEYLAAGKAIIASDVGEVDNMLKGVGVLVPPGDENSLSREILRLLDNANLRIYLGEKARHRAETVYNWTNTAAAINTMYQKNLFLNNKAE